MKFCLWGWREGYVQVGSVEDVWAQCKLRFEADVRRVVVTVGQVLRPAFDAMVEESRRLVERLGMLA